ncbi:MAG: hypothetical protein KDM81_11075, partial [Verrucomicrobiae bacterium]|nr:hypothetical protein [Verrucomicrobiae bacterium]
MIRQLTREVLLPLIGGSILAAHAFDIYTDLEAWQAATGGTPVLEQFDATIAQNNQITFACGVVSEGFDPVSAPFNHVTGGSWYG